MGLRAVALALACLITAHAYALDPQGQTPKDAVFSLEFKTVDEFRDWYDANVAETVISPNGLFSIYNPHSKEQIEFFTRAIRLRAYLFKKEEPFRAFLADGRKTADISTLQLLPEEWKSRPILAFGNVACHVFPTLPFNASDEELALGKLIRSEDLKALTSKLDAGLNVNAVAAYNDKKQGIVRGTLFEHAVLIFKPTAKVFASPSMELLIKRGADLNAPFLNDRSSPAQWAIANKQNGMLEYFLSRGALPYRLKDGKPYVSFLVNAVANKQMALVKILLAHGADPNMPNDNGVTPVFYASGPYLTLLLEKGARLDVKNKQGETPLDQALSVGNEELLQAAIKTGQTISAAAVRKSHAAHVFAARGNLEMVKYFVEPVGIDVNEKKGDENLLYWANYCSTDNTALMDWLLKKGAEIDSKPKPEKSILTQAVWDGKFSHVKFLLAHGAVVNDPEGSIPDCLAWAVENKRTRLEMTKLLIASGARIRDKRTTLLHMAAAYPDLEYFKYVASLFENQLDEKNSDKQSPAMVAAGYRNMQVFSYLVKAGVDIASFAGKGGYLEMLAKDDDEIENFLNDYRAKQ